MPAASSPALPRRWRPLGTRLAGWFFFGVLCLVSLAAWILLGDLRSRFEPASVVVVFLMYAATAVVVHALTRCRLDATEQGLVVVNGYRRREFDWAQAVSLTMPPGAPWAILDLADGTSVSVVALQATDGARARTALREVRALLER